MIGASPPSSQRRRCVAAARRTHSPRGTIRPRSSATGMNSSGSTSPRSGSIPADQRLRADDAPRLHLHLRLEVDDELAVRERPAEPRLRVEGLHRPEPQLGPEGLEPAPLSRLGLAERRVGALHQAPRVFPVAGEERDPDARAERDRPALRPRTGSRRRPGPFRRRPRRRPGPSGTRTQTPNSSGPTRARMSRAFTAAASRPAAAAEGLVSGRPPERLVEGREAVDVEDHEGERLRAEPARPRAPGRAPPRGRRGSRSP